MSNSDLFVPEDISYGECKSPLDINQRNTQISEMTLQNGFKGASLEEITITLDFSRDSIDPAIHPFEAYSILESLLPPFADKDVTTLLLEEYATTGSEKAREAILLLNLKTVFSVAAPYLSGDPDRDFDIIQTGIVAMDGRVISGIILGSEVYFSEYIHPHIHLGIQRFFKAEIYRSPDMITDENLLLELGSLIRLGIEEGKVEVYAEELSSKYGISTDVLNMYLNFMAAQEVYEQYTVEEEIWQNILNEKMQEDLSKDLRALTDLQRKMVVKYFAEGKSSSEIAEELGKKHKNVPESILANVYRNLKHRSVPQKLWKILQENEY